MKLLKLRLANWLTGGEYVEACRSAQHWQAIAGNTLKDLATSERHLEIAENALAHKDTEIAALKKQSEAIRTTLTTAIEKSNTVNVAPIIMQAIRDARAMTKGGAR